MKKSALLELTLDEAKAKLDELKAQLVTIRFDKVVGHVENPLNQRTIRRGIARLNTIVQEYESGIRKAK